MESNSRNQPPLWVRLIILLAGMVMLLSALSLKSGTRDVVLHYLPILKNRWLAVAGFAPVLLLAFVASRIWPTPQDNRAAMRAIEGRSQRLRLGLSIVLAYCAGAGAILLLMSRPSLRGYTWVVPLFVGIGFIVFGVHQLRQAGARSSSPHRRSHYWACTLGGLLICGVAVGVALIQS